MKKSQKIMLVVNIFIIAAIFVLNYFYYLDGFDLDRSRLYGDLLSCALFFGVCYDIEKSATRSISFGCFDERQGRGLR